MTVVKEMEVTKITAARVVQWSDLVSGCTSLKALKAWLTQRI